MFSVLMCAMLSLWIEWHKLLLWMQIGELEITFPLLEKLRFVGTGVKSGESVCMVWEWLDGRDIFDTVWSWLEVREDIVGERLELKNEGVDVSPVEGKLVDIESSAISSVFIRSLVSSSSASRGSWVLLVVRPDGCREHLCTVTYTGGEYFFRGFSPRRNPGNVQSRQSECKWPY